LTEAFKEVYERHKRLSEAIQGHGDGMRQRRTPEVEAMLEAMVSQAETDRNKSPLFTISFDQPREAASGSSL